MKTEASKLYRSEKFKKLNTLFICIAILISSNVFSQHVLLKRKYMKGRHIEKNKKSVDKMEKYSKNNIAFSSQIITNQFEKSIQMNKKDSVLILKNENVLKNLYLGEIASESKKSITETKKEKKALPIQKFYSKHNTLQTDTALYSSISNAIITNKKSCSIPANTEDKLEAMAIKKSANNSRSVSSDIFFNIGSTIVTILVIAFLAYLTEMFPIFMTIIISIAVIALFIYICNGIGNFLGGLLTAFIPD